MMKKKGYSKGGMKKKGYAKGGMPMNPETGTPTFVGDGKGKMAGGGSAMKKKGYAKGGMKKKGYAKGGMKKKGYAKGGAAKKRAIGGILRDTVPFGANPGIGDFERSQAPGIAAAAPAALEPFRGNLLDKQVSSNLLDNAMMTRASSPTSGASNSPSASSNQNQNLTSTINNTNTLGAGTTGQAKSQRDLDMARQSAQKMVEPLAGLPSMSEPFDVPGFNKGAQAPLQASPFKPVAQRGMRKGGAVKTKLAKGTGAALRGRKASRIF